MKSIKLILLFLGFISITPNANAQSIAREWNELNLFAVQNGFARPTVIARDLWHVSAGMYEAYAAYDLISRQYFLGETVGGATIPFDGIDIPGTEAEIEAARHEAICHAAYGILSHRYANLPGLNEIFVQQAFNNKMNQYGYNIANQNNDYTTGDPAALGNYIADQIIAFGIGDGANEANNYINQYYSPINDPLVTAFDGNPDIEDPNRWQPLTLAVAIDQGGNPLPINTPAFLSPEWGNVKPFSLTDDDKTVYLRDGNIYNVYCDPGPPPLLDTIHDETALNDPYKWNFAMVVTWSSLMDPTDGEMIDISPAGIGNNSEYPESPLDYQEFYGYTTGLDGSQGYTQNPVTGLPYEEQLVPKGDYARVLAEFWADGPDSETPPGHWFSIMNYVNDQPGLVKKWAGEGEVMSDLEWDIKSYFALGGAMHDCAISAWGIKGYYDYVRPISAIRYMGDQGQSSDSLLPNYSAAGLPLIPDYIELVQPGDPLTIGAKENVNKIKVKSWKGPDYLDQIDNNGEIEDGVQDSTIAGVGWILTEDWWPYQRPTFVSPPFAGYISGHSTYSRAAAEVLTLITGDEYFPGGMGTFEAPMNDFLVFEDGPSVDIELQWAKYKDASDQCSLSRIYGGIHPPADDIPGRIIGQKIGERVFDLSTFITNPTEPRVLSNSVNTSAISDAFTGNNFTLAVTFNQDMDQTSTPTLTFVEDLSQTLAPLSGAWMSSNTYQWTYSTADGNVHFDEITFNVTGALDLDGELQEEFIKSNEFIIDTENPTISQASFESDINESMFGFEVSLIITLSEEVLISAANFPFTNDDPTINSLVLASNQLGWISPNEFEISYNVFDADEEFYEMTIQPMGVFDLVGNPVIVEEFVITSFLDTKAPSVVSMNPSAPYINETVANAGQFILEVNFDDQLDTLNIPTIISPNEDPSNTLTWNQTASSFANGDSTYLYVFDVVDMDQELLDIDVQINNIVDDAQNTKTGELFVDVVNVDTKAPAYLSCVVPTLITENNLGTAQFNVEVEFDEILSDMSIPTLSFSTTDVSTSLILNAGESMFIDDNSTYVFVYDVIDADLEFPVVNIEVSDAADLAGNFSPLESCDNDFILDTKGPGVISITPSADLVNESMIGSSTFSLVVEYDDMLDTTIVPTIIFSEIDIATALIFNEDESGFSDPSSSYTFVYNVVDTDIEFSDVNVEVNSATDSFGNVTLNDMVTAVFDIDLRAAMVLNVNPVSEYVNEATALSGTYSVEINFDDELNTDEIPILSFPVEDPTNSMTLNTGLSEFSNGNSTYTFVYDVLDLNEEISNIDISISNAVDNAMNMSVEQTIEDELNVDTKAPEVLSGTFSEDVISDEDSGDLQTLLISFDEPILESTLNINFSATQPASLVLNNALWDENDLSVSYDIVDANEEELINISVSDATDIAGNLIANYDFAETMILDNKNPAATVSANTLDITAANQSDGFQLMVEFDEEMNQSVLPLISFPDEDPIGDITETANSDWTADIYTFDFDVNSLTPLGFIDVDVTGAEDIYGNEMVVSNLPDYFSIELDIFLPVNEIESSNFNVYPNPISPNQNFIIESENILDFRIQFYDYSGRLLDVSSLTKGYNQMEVSTKGLASGLYFLRLSTEDSSSIVKVEILR